LKHDPKLIFDYVHNHVDYVPHFGSLKGATLTYYDGSGNDFDQASLMVALLRASGFTAQFQYGTMTFPYTTTSPLANLLDSPSHFQNILAAGGIPYQVVSNTVDVSRVWVTANINGTNYLFDPALKTYTNTPKINLVGALGYSRADLLAAAGGTVTNDYVQNLGEVAIRAKLVLYSTNLAAFIRSQHPNKSLAELLGRRSIVETNLGQFSASFPWPSVVTATWNEIPPEYTTTLRLQHVGIDVTYCMPEIAGKRFTLTYAVGDFHPELRLDGQLVASGTSTSQGSSHNLTVSVDHPYAADGGTYADQTSTYVNRSGSTYAIISDFGGTSERLILKRQREAEKAKTQGSIDTSEPVLGETLNIIGLTWMREGNMAAALLADLSGGIVICHHRLGRTSQEDSYYIDVATQFSSHGSKDTGMTDWSHFRASGLVRSAFEHSVLEQVMGPEIPAVSTARLLQLANSKSNKIYYATSNNFVSIRPQLHDYSTSILNELDSLVAGGGYTILPENGQLSLGQWHGAGYVTTEYQTNTTSLGMKISGGLNGGYGSQLGFIEQLKVEAEIRWNFDWQFRLGSGGAISVDSGPFGAFDFEGVGGMTRWFSRDPVDMASGSFVFEHRDLAIGSSNDRSLSISRYYNNSKNLAPRRLGARWTHSHDVWLREISDGEAALGSRQPVEAAALIAALYVSRDLLSDETDVKRWVVSALVSKWAADQLVTNSIAVHLGSQLLQFVKLADGTYSPPPSITTALTNNGNRTFSLLDPFGSRSDFNSSNRVASVTDVDGNTTIFNYTGDKLTAVSNSFGRRLILAYTGELLTSVLDSAGHSVSYGYDLATNLVSFTDPEGKVWSYGYDGEHRMTRLVNPLGIMTATNFYDSLGRVATQITPRQGGTNATYNFYFSGFRNIEEDPLGNQTLYLYDTNERPLGQENALGHRSTQKYDGQNHVIESTDPRGNKITHVYDGNHNLIKTVNAKGEITRYIYDSQFRLTDVLDALVHQTHFDYDAEHHPISTRDAVGNQTAASYYPNGFVQTRTDAKGVVAMFAYDSHSNPVSAQVTNHPSVTFAYDPAGRLTNLTDQVGASTTFAYDKRGLTTNRTDALGRTTIFTRDAAGQLSTVTDRKGDMITNSYTPSGKPAMITLPDLSTITFTYDVRDNLVAMQDSLGITTNTYDAANRLTSMTDPHGFTVSYGRDAAGNVTSLTYPGNKVVSYGYDELNRLKTVTNWLGQTVAYTYDQAGRLVQFINFNGAQAIYDFDNANRLTLLENRKSDGTAIATYRFYLDPNGNRTNIVQNEPLVPIINSQTNTYSYNPQRNRLLSAGGTNFGYDLEGQLASMNTNTFSFDALHRLVAVTGSNQLQFAYDGMNRRLRATRDGVVTRYIYDAAGNLLAEADGTNAITHYYVHGAGLLAMVSATGNTYCYHFNAVGSTIAMTDGNQALVNKYAYDSFGSVANQAEAVSQDFKFVGSLGVMAERNGFYYMRARYYDPGVGRFISEDPIGFAGGSANLFSYAANNPIIHVDPSGKFSDEDIFQELANIFTGAVGGYHRGGWQETVRAGAGASAFLNWEFAIGGLPGAKFAEGFDSGATRDWQTVSLTLADTASEFAPSWFSIPYQAGRSYYDASTSQPGLHNSPPPTGGSGSLPGK